MDKTNKINFYALLVVFAASVFINFSSYGQRQQQALGFVHRMSEIEIGDANQLTPTIISNAMIGNYLFIDINAVANCSGVHDMTVDVDSDTLRINFKQGIIVVSNDNGEPYELDEDGDTLEYFVMEMKDIEMSDSNCYYTFSYKISELNPMATYTVVFNGVLAKNAAKVNNEAYDAMLNDLLSHTVEEVNVSDINDMDSTIIFLDARERKEFEVSHIKNAVWIGYDDFDMSRLDSISKDNKVVVYCSVGYRSEKVSEKLIANGYQDVSNLYGSIFEWVNEGNTVYDMDGNATTRVHAYDEEWGKWLEKGDKVVK